MATETFEKVELTDFATKLYYEYGISVIEDRAIPDFRDGLNPVHRRLLWTAHTMGLNSKTKPVKSAKVVGMCLGNYHPHGDTSAYQALVGLTNTNSCQPLFSGEGNWGSLTEPSAAAMRYTETKLSSFSDKVFFDKFYLPVIDYCPNYDSSTKEPLVLPALLPVLLLNGKAGIAPGATVEVPAATLPSVLAALDVAFTKRNKLSPKDLYDTLRFTSTYGGKEAKPKTKEEVDDRKRLFVSTKGKTTLLPSVAITNTGYIINQFANDTSIPKVLETLAKIPEVADVEDSSSIKDVYGQVDVKLTRGTDPRAVLPKVLKVLTRKVNAVLNFTTRYLDDTGQGAAKLTPMSLTQFFISWVDWRFELEVKACKYWAGKAQEEIDHLNLMVLAVDNRAVILKSLEKTCSQAELEEWLAKQLGITAKQAATIYQLRVVQLRKLEKQALTTKIKEVTQRKVSLIKRGKNPLPFLKEQLKELQ